MFVISVARYLTGLTIGTYDENGAGGDIFISRVPANPDALLVLTPTGGEPADGHMGYDRPTFQARARSNDVKGAYDKLRAVYGALHGLSDFTLPDGTYVVGCWARQSDPQYIGADANGRHEYVLNFVAEIQAATAHRD